MKRGAFVLATIVAPSCIVLVFHGHFVTALGLGSIAGLLAGLVDSERKKDN